MPGKSKPTNLQIQKPSTQSLKCGPCSWKCVIHRRSPCICLWRRNADNALRGTRISVDQHTIISPFVFSYHANPYQPLTLLRDSSLGHQGQQDIPEWKRYSLNREIVGYILLELALGCVGHPRIFQAEILISHNICI